MLLLIRLIPLVPGRQLPLLILFCPSDHLLLPLPLSPSIRLILSIPLSQLVQRRQWPLSIQLIPSGRSFRLIQLNQLGHFHLLHLLCLLGLLFLLTLLHPLSLWLLLLLSVHLPRLCPLPRLLLWIRMGLRHQQHLSNLSIPLIRLILSGHLLLLFRLRPSIRLILSGL